MYMKMEVIKDLYGTYEMIVNRFSDGLWMKNLENKIYNNYNQLYKCLQSPIQSIVIAMEFC